ncbi:hypothetical protein ACFRI7_14355 [Streptomyces sp. NPDC056716]|uniref:hypothetical protein n=1 Tax=unclassified Streptomyces TaxID=2593676 RepID=UPI003680BBC9
MHVHSDIHELGVRVDVLTDKPPRERVRAELSQLYAVCGLGAPSQLPMTAYGPRLVAVRVRQSARVLEQVLPLQLGDDRDALLRKAAARGG